MTTAQLNAVASLLTANGIEATKDVVFSVCIKTLIEAGMPIEVAFDAVLGEGHYTKFSGNLYDALRAS